MRIFFNKREILLVVVFVLVLVFLIPVFVSAQTGGTGVGDPTGGTGIGNPTGGTGVVCPPGQSCLQNPLNGITGFCGFIKMLFVTVGTIAVPIAVLFLVFAGFKFVWARGNPTGLEEAKKNLFYTILGIAIFFAAWLLALAIGNTLASFGVSVIGNC